MKWSYLFTCHVNITCIVFFTTKYEFEEIKIQVSLGRKENQTLEALTIEHRNKELAQTMPYSVMVETQFLKVGIYFLL